MNLETLRSFRPQIEAISAANGIENIRVFGSVARGEAREDSDVDLLVTVRPDAGWGYLGFGVELEELLGCKVDVVSDNGIKGAMKERVLAEAKPLL